MDQSHIRNFCIIAHIDHGKSTLADRLLELTGTVEKRNMQDQLLDSMDLERERGITIKLAPARMAYKGYMLNLIDTPGHVDFNYEVSRSLAAVEGAVLLVDATQGVQAQTIANLYLAMGNDLEIIPVLNKIELPAADVEGRAQEIIELLGCKREEILEVSGKTGLNVEKLLDAIITRIPPPNGRPDHFARALVFDSAYDDYRGVVAYVRMVDGELTKGQKLLMMATGVESEITDIGFLKPKFHSIDALHTGEIGVVVTGRKDIEGVRVGDTMTTVHSAIEPLAGYKTVTPMVFAGIFPKEGNNYEELREGMMKLKLSDSSLTFEPERSMALGFGFRCGFLGMLHLEIIKERLEREFSLEIIVTVPSVAYHVTKTNKESLVVKSPHELPDRPHIEKIEEPWADVSVIVPSAYIGNVMSLVNDRRGIYKTTEYLHGNRAILRYDMALSTIIVDFNDKLKSVTAGYASINYEVTDYREADIVRMDILVAEEPVEELSMLVYEADAHKEGKAVVAKLKEKMPRQQFVLKLQAAIGGTVVAGDRITPLKKDVTAKLYGGDVTRKRKLLEKQKKGKKKMMALGKGTVDIPSSIYIDILKK